MQRPQDVLVALKLMTLGSAPWRQADLAAELGLSQAEIHNVLRRLAESALYEPTKKRLFQSGVTEFVLHGLRYVYPPRLGAPTRGIPTAVGAPVLARHFNASEELPVWPHDEGTVRGVSFEPIYATAPSAALRDPQLYDLLALADAIRSGRARERKLAAEAFADWSAS